MVRPALALVLVLVTLPLPLAAQTVEWWQKDFDGALAAAKEKPAGMVLLYCWRDKSDACSSMFGALSDKEMAPALVDFVCMGAKDDDAGKVLHARFGIEIVPTVLFVGADGAALDVVQGYVPLKEFLAHVARIRAGTDTIPDLRKRGAAAPQDFVLQLQLVRKLRAAGDKKGALAVIDVIGANDPKLTSEPAAEAMLLKITDQTFRPEIAPKDYDLKPLREFLNKQKNKRILFLGWDRMAAAEYRRDNLKLAVEAADRAWKNIPPDQVLDWGQNIASKAYESWKELDKIDKGILKRALDISERALKEVEKKHKAVPDNAYYASALYLHAAVQIVNNLRKEAFAAMDKAIALDPENENLKKARDRWLDGSK